MSLGNAKPSRAARWGLVLAVMAIAAPAVAHAAPAAEALADRKPAGVLAGLMLTVLVGYALWLHARPLLGTRDRDLRRAIYLLAVLFVIKACALVYFGGFGVDVGTYEAWALKLADLGPARMYEPGYFIDYPPGYLYLLWAAGWFAHLIGADNGESLRIIVEMPALVGDFVLALIVYISMRRFGRPLSAWAALVMVALNPALLFDSVVWGQTDSVLTLAMLLSVALILEAEFEIGWALAALAVLIKPQALTLLPVLGLWTLMRLSPRAWWRAGLAFTALIVIAVAPFQAGHPWTWLPQLYTSGAAYYHETSVNAFNLIALLGGIRQSDTTTFLGVSCFTIGMALLVPLYAYVAAILLRNASPRNLLFASFIALYGFFIVAPRMHERYLYSAVVFAVPLALEEPAMLAVFAILTLTCFANLAYVLYTLRTVVFMDGRDPFAMAVSALDVIAFAFAAAYGWKGVAGQAAASAAAVTKSLAEPTAIASQPAAAGEQWLRARLAPGRSGLRPQTAPAEFMAPIAWRRIDSVMLAIFTATAAVLHFWNLNHPAELVFDEVHFVGQARHYLRAENFLDPHPPLAKLISALGIIMFGDHPWAWRLGVATLGTILIPVTYLLARRMFHSRLAAAFAAGFVMCDGLYLVDSRIAVIDIVYLTFAAVSYVLLFRFMQNTDLRDRRRTLLAMGVSLGLCLGSKLYVPGITFLLVTGFVVFTLMRPEREAAPPIDRSVDYWRVAGALAIVGSVASLFYLACFLPHYYLGWWGGIEDLFHYYKDVMWYEKSVSTATHPYSSPWWSWPLMLRPVAYWQNFPNKGDVSTIWGAGNPILWWAVIPAITITAVRALERPGVTRTFIVISYLAYFVIWIPIGRILFLYHYMPSVYIGYLALAAVIADLCRGECETWESAAILLSVLTAVTVGFAHIADTYKFAWTPITLSMNARTIASIIVGIGYVFLLFRDRTTTNYALLSLAAMLLGLLWFVPPIMAGLSPTIVLALIYVATITSQRAANRFVAGVFLIGAAAAFIYFLPVWLALPITRSGYYARMWLEGPGLRNWI
ncbi:MAG TPA: phospholipid carrier-dependent glycosyltransferase [Candidatus Binataceae bacterium]|nr:phospholipid carrier-dependent glycosyltransferase [Candidatus Binataceae bacterium]